MPLGRPALSAGEIATIRRWIDEGARETITLSRSDAKVGGAARARATCGTRCCLAGLDDASRSIRQQVSQRARRSRTGADRRRRIREAGLPRYLGSASPAGRSSGVSRRQEARTSDPRSSNGSLPTTTSTPNTGSRSGTTSCGTTKVPITTRRRHHARASAPGCCQR